MRARSFVLGALFAACAHAPPPAEVHPPAGSEDQLVPALGLTLSLPEGTETEYAGGGAVFYLPDGETVSVEEWPSAPLHTEPPLGSPVDQDLADGGHLKYLLQAIGDGEVALSGALTLGDATFAVHCHEPAADPRRCLAWLGTARLSR